MKEKLENFGNGFLKGLKIALCVVTVLPLLYWIASALFSNGMSSDKIQQGVSDSAECIENQRGKLSKEFKKIGFSEKSFKEAIDGLESGEVKAASVPGHAILLMKDKEGQVTVVDNGYFGGSFGHGQMLYSKVLKDNNVNYVGLNTGGNSCGQAVINIASALQIDKNGVFDFDQTAQNLGVSAVKKSYGSAKIENVNQQSIEKSNSNELSSFPKLENVSISLPESVKKEVVGIIKEISTNNKNFNEANTTSQEPKSPRAAGAER